MHDNSHKAPLQLNEKDGSLDIKSSFASGVDCIANIAHLNMSYSFYDAKTGAPINVQHSFITFSSLDGPVLGTSTGFEYVGYKGVPGRIFTVENSIVRQITDPMDSSQLVMAGQIPRPTNWPYNSSTASTLEVRGSKLDFIYGITRVNTKTDSWTTPMFTLSTVTLGAPEIEAPKLTSDKTVNSGKEFKYDLTQKVNTLNEDLLNKYNNWNETIQLPKETTYNSGIITNDNGQELPKDSYIVNYDKSTHKIT